MKSNVKNYTDEDLLTRMQDLPSYNGIPKGYHIIAVRSDEDEYNTFDDKLYLFRGRRFVAVMSCTTHAGAYGLKNFLRWNSKGTAVIKSDEIYYDTFMKTDGKGVRHHRGKVKALRQIKPMLYYRDGNADNKIDEDGPVYYANYYTNIHPNSYKYKTGIRNLMIGGWSVGCVVVNDLNKYWGLLIGKLPYQTPITLTMLKEFKKDGVFI